jgi:ligand-binding SRPBCC domain-containing protein
MPLFETQILLSCRPEVLFDFLMRPAMVMALNPPEMNLTLLEAPDIVTEGSRIRFQVEALGFKQQMVHEVINLQRPAGFLVREIEGVLKKYEHEHLIELQPDGGTILFERVLYEPPGGMVGFLLTEARVREGLEKNFGHRHRELKQQLERL